ncbi:hypothetical protein [Streptomyces sp. MI02-7b]|uniref:Mom family adenine methylcarbamoylation protein n=1 Tax=Streptomyces sp. MI02-7b TaxID=462941 RepID=UPI0029A5A6AA|nr:hypothetical protein [Streptomyces sp. MI02-7b]MDX3075908.1 hypothetical protein [Streptomyces sp. MI02-7b]
MSHTFEQLSLDGLSQRWRQRRHSWRHTSEGGFDPARYQTRPLPSAPARAFVTEHHYSSSWPAIRLSYGLYDRAASPRGGALVGVLALGVPMHATVLSGVFPDVTPYRSALELSRLVLLDSCEANSESFFVAKALHMAAAVGIRGVLAHSDPHVRQRTTPTGTEQYLPGHWGGCYQASNMSYLGKTRPRTLVMLPDGTILYDRSISKVRALEPGHGGVERRLVQLGARARAPREPGRQWISEALATIGATRLRHSGNHRYALAIGPRSQRPRIHGTVLPYPKPHAEAFTVQ